MIGSLSHAKCSNFLDKNTHGAEEPFPYESRGGSSDFRLPTSDFQLRTSDFQLPTSDFRLPASVAMKGGDRPTRLLPYAKMLLVPKTFFSLLLGRLCSRRFWLSRLFHIERSWHTYRFYFSYCGFCFWSAGFALWCKSIFFKAFYYGQERALNFLQNAFWTRITMWLWF